MSPEQLYDSLEAVVGKTGARPDKPRQAVGALRGGNNPRAAFVAFFQVDEGADPTEYQAGIPQALRLMNSAQLNNRAVLLEQAMKAGQPAQVIEQLYLGSLSRRPNSGETEKLTDYVKKQGDARAAYQDILWALLNSSEFTLNH